MRFISLGEEWSFFPEFFFPLGSDKRFGAVSSPGAPSLGPSAALTLLLPYVKIQQNENIQLGFSPIMEEKMGF